MEPYEFLLHTIQEAGKLLLQKRDEGFEISSKGGNPRDIVTSVDLAVNDFIIAEIRRAYPEHGIYSEEGSGAENKSEYLWTIDPIDGSANFARGIPHFAISLGLLHKGEPALGAVFNPVTQELFSFKKGEGAFLNGKRIFVSNITDLAQSYVFFHTGRKKELHEWGGRSYAALLGRAKKTENFAGSSLDACFVAAGRIEANIYGTLSTLDISAAIGILKEAGGIVANEKGEEISFSKESQKIFMANNREILSQAREIIQ
ncbi:MAG: inositol monophosphatase [Candidatus Paceibacterota bacterium]